MYFHNGYYVPLPLWYHLSNHFHSKIQVFPTAHGMEFQHFLNCVQVLSSQYYLYLLFRLHRARLHQRNALHKGCYITESRNAERKKPFLDENQAKDLLKMVEDNTQFNRIIKVLLFTGMRSGECLALRWQDIDFENKTIHIENTLTDVGGKHWLQPPKTATSNRYIALSDILADIFREQKKYNDEKLSKLGKLYTYPEMVFTTESGNFVDRSGLNTQFRRFVKGTDFDFITLHSLRHCNATLLINSGIDLKIVSELLGHSDVSTTANVYADVLKSSKAKVADLISLKLNGN